MNNKCPVCEHREEEKRILELAKKDASDALDKALYYLDFGSFGYMELKNKQILLDDIPNFLREMIEDNRIKTTLMADFIAQSLSNDDYFDEDELARAKSSGKYSDSEK